MSNPPNMHIILTAYGLADDLYRLVDCADGAGVTWHVFLHSQYPDVVKVCEELDELKNVHLYDYRVNRGLAKSWNEGFYLAYETYGADATFIASDDALCTYDEVVALACKAVENPSAYMVSGWGREIRTETDGDMLFSMAVISRRAIQEVGYFDQNFFPIYFEDRDWYRRAMLMTGSWDSWKIVLPDTHIIHQGSKTIWTNPVLMEQHHRTFVANREYYLRKWGGLPEQEGYHLPFDDSRYGLCIPYACVDAPYEGQNRTDFEIVRM